MFGKIVNMQPHFFPINNKRFALIAVLGVVLTFIGFAGAVATSPAGGELRPSFINKALMATVIIGVLTVLFAIINLLSKKRGLTINNMGVTFSAGLAKFGPIAWDDIIDVEEKKYMTNNFIVLKLEDPQAFVNTLSGMSKRMAGDSQKISGSPAVINASMVDGDKDEIVQLIKQHMRK